VKEEEKNRSVEKQIQNGREEKKKNPRNGLDRNGLKSTACVFFLVCRSPSVQKGRGEEAVTDPPCFRGGAWVHAPPVAVARGGVAPPLFHNHRRCPECSSTVPEAFCNFPMLLCTFRLLIFDLFRTFDVL
jgi:hypothetical protein